MKHLFFYTVYLFFATTSFSQKDSVQFILIDTLAAPGSDFYLACNKNNWNPADENYKFKNAEDGNRFLICYFDKGTSLQFKFTRGSWQTVECDADGKDLDNRTLKTDTSKFVIYFIDGWKDKFSPFVKQHTASPHVKILDTAFYMPQLNRRRRIWIYLPEQYVASKKTYPVMYMHDGQNVFDEFTSGFGEWGVDECLDTLIAKGKPPCIVVGIDNGPQRFNEYNPYDNERFGNGEGDLYVDFIVHTLKPYIDKHYRTIPLKENTIIAGSSMGGLISYYAMLKYPAVFGKAGVFSPAFWTAPEIKNLTDSLAKKLNGKLFFYMGGQEGGSYVQDMKDVMEKAGTVSSAMIYAVIDPGASHNEQAWRKWFAEFYNWIMADGYNNVIKLDKEN